MKKVFSILALGIVVGTMMMSCSNEESDVVPITKEVNIEINVGEKYEFDKGSYYIEQGTNNFIVSISESGVVKGIHEGITKFTIKTGSTTYTGTIKVNANTTLYVDLTTFLGKERSEYEALFGEPITVSGPTSAGMTYNYEGKMFEIASGLICDTEGIIKAAVVTLPAGYEKKVNEHLGDRYFYYGKSSSGSLIYIDSYYIKDYKTMILLSINNDLSITVTYNPYSGA